MKIFKNFYIVYLTIAIAIFGGIAHAENLIIDGSFESYATPNGFAIFTTSNLPVNSSWQPGPGAKLPDFLEIQDASFGAAADGTKQVELATSAPSSIQQTFTVGTDYTGVLSWYFKPRTGTLTYDDYEVLLDGVSIYKQQNFSGFWVNYQKVTTASRTITKGSHVLVFKSIGPSDAGARIDNVVLEATPIALGTPTGINATAGTYADKVVVSWNKVNNATGYSIYRNGTLIGTVGDVATYNDTSAIQGNSYLYSVAANFTSTSGQLYRFGQSIQGSGYKLGVPVISNVTPLFGKSKFTFTQQGRLADTYNIYVDGVLNKTIPFTEVNGPSGKVVYVTANKTTDYNIQISGVASGTETVKSNSISTFELSPTQTIAPVVTTSGETVNNISPIAKIATDSNFTYALNGQPASGVVTLNGKLFSFTANNSYTGDDDITFAITDMEGVSYDAEIPIKQACSAPTINIVETTLPYYKNESDSVSINLVNNCSATYSTKYELLSGTTVLSTTTVDVNTGGSKVLAWNNLSEGEYTVKVTATDKARTSTVVNQTKTINVLLAQAPSYASGTGTGLLAKYYNNTALTGTPSIERIENPWKTWGSESPGAPIVGFANFSIKYTGYIEIPTTGSYVFNTLTDDGLRLKINGVRYINSWWNQGPTNYQTSAISLNAGDFVSVEMDYYNGVVTGISQLSWKVPSSGSFVQIPNQYLYGELTLPSPTNVSATKGTLAGKVKVSWNAVTGTSGYKIYRNGVEIGSITGQSPLEYDDTTVVDTTTYQYAVAAVKQGSTNHLISKTVDGFAKLGVPTLTASKGTYTNLIRLEWNLISGAQSYKVYSDVNGVYTEISETTGLIRTVNKFNDPAKYTFRVAPVKDGVVGELSLPSVGYANVAPVLTTSTFKTFSGTPILLSPIVTDANSADGDTYSFLNVYGSTTNEWSSISPSGNSLSFTGKPNYVGTFQLPVSVMDAAGATTTGSITIDQSCKAPTVQVNEISKPYLKLDNDKISVGLDNGGCSQNYDVKFEILNGANVVKTETKVIGGNASTEFNWSGVTNGNYIIRTTVTDKLYPTTVVSKDVNIVVTDFQLPKIKLDNVIKSSYLVMVDLFGSSIDSNLANCVATYSSTDAIADKTKCLYEYVNLPSGLSVNNGVVSGKFNSNGTQLLKVNYFKYDLNNVKNLIGSNEVNIETMPLSSLVFTSPETIEGKQFITEVNLAVSQSSGTTCPITKDSAAALLNAQSGNLSCLLTLNNVPANSTGTPNGFKGKFNTLGTTAIPWSIKIYNINGNTSEEVLVSQGTTNIVISAADILYELETIPYSPPLTQLLSNINLVMEKKGADTCRLTVNPADSSEKCLVEWIRLPEGIEQNNKTSVPNLVGKMFTSGTITFEYKVSYVDALGVQTQLGGNKTMTTTVLPAPKPTVNLYAGNKLAEDVYEAPLSGGLITFFELGGESKLMKGTITYNSTSTTRSYTSISKSKKPIVIDAGGSLWDTNTVNIKTEIVGANIDPADKTITLVSSPSAKVVPRVITPEIYFTNEKLADIKVFVGTISSNGYEYNPTQMGIWKVKLIDSKTGAVISDEVTVNDRTGEATLQVNLDGYLDLKMVPVAETTTPDGLYTIVRKGRTKFVRVNQGTAVKAQLTVLRNGSKEAISPLKRTFKLVYDTASDLSVRDEVVYETKKEGESEWTPYTAKRCINTCSLSFYDGRYQVRAKLSNKNTGVISYTNILDVYAYPGVVIGLEGSTVMYPTNGMDVNITTKDSSGNPVDTVIDWRIIDSRNRTEPLLTGTGNNVKFNSADVKQYMLEVEAVRLDVATPNVQDVFRKRFPLSFINVKRLSTKIFGAKKIEIGKEVLFKSMAKADFERRNSSQKVINEWTLPNGSKVVSDELTWTPLESDLAYASKNQIQLSLSSWVEGFKESTIDTDVKAIEVWKYTWPEFELITKLKTVVAPTDANVVVAPENNPENIANFRNIPREDITYTWNFDNRMQILKSFSGGHQLLMPSPGSYNVSITIADKRGNSTTLNADLVTKDILDIILNMQVKNSVRYLHDPLKVYVKTFAFGGYPNDTISSWVYKLDGNPLDFGGKHNGYISDISAGSHTIEVSVTSSLGRSASKSATIVVPQNIPPICELTSERLNNDIYSVVANCSDPEGGPLRYNWMINDIPHPESSSVWLFGKDRPIDVIKLRAVDQGNAYIDKTITIN